MSPNDHSNPPQGQQRGLRKFFENFQVPPNCQISSNFGGFRRGRGPGYMGRATTGIPMGARIARLPQNDQLNPSQGRRKLKTIEYSKILSQHTPGSKRLTPHKHGLEGGWGGTQTSDLRSLPFVRGSTYKKKNVGDLGLHRRTVTTIHKKLLTPPPPPTHPPTPPQKLAPEYGEVSKSKKFIGGSFCLPN